MKLFALRAARLHALGVGRRPALPALQPGREDEGHDRGRARDQPALGRDRRARASRRTCTSRGRARHPRAAEARGHGARQHRADRQVHGELLLRRRRPAAPVPRRDDAAQRRLPLRPGRRRAAWARSASTTGSAAFEASTLAERAAAARAGRRAARDARLDAADEEQRKDIDFLLAIGDAVHARRLRPAGPRGRAATRTSATTSSTRSSTCSSRDFSQAAVDLQSKPSSTEEQIAHCLRMVRKPAFDAGRYDRLWEQEVAPLAGAYELSWEGARAAV